MKSRLGRWEKITYEKVKNLSFKLSEIEGKKIDIPEITRRTFNDEIINRLIIGSEENRRFRRGR